MTTKYYTGLNLHRYGTNASWVDEDLKINEDYLGVIKRGKYIKVETNKLGSVTLVEAWEQRFNNEQVINFDREKTEDGNLNYFIKKSEAFKNISILETEKLFQYYEYDETELEKAPDKNDIVTLKSIKRSISYRTEYYYDSQNNHIKTCHYDRNINGQDVVMSNCKEVVPPRKLDAGEIPDFPN